MEARAVGDWAETTNVGGGEPDRTKQDVVIIERSMGLYRRLNQRRLVP
jgi:hypothetical protein